MSFLNICDENYTKGSYKRDSFQRYGYYNNYKYRELEALKDGFDIHFTDDLFLEICSKYQVNINIYKKYISEVKKLLLNNDVWNAVTEEVYEKIHKKRIEFLPEGVLQEYKHKLFLNSFKNSKNIVINGINQLDFLKKMWYNTSSVIITVSDFSLLKAAVKMAEESIAAQKKVYLLVKSDKRCLSINEEHWNFAFSSVSSDKIKQALKRGDIEFIYESGLGLDVNFARISPNDELEKQINHSSAMLIIYGEEIFLSAKNLRIPSFSYTTNHSLYAKAVQNLFSEDKISVIYTPKSYSAIENVPIVEKTRFDYSDFFNAFKKYGEEVYAYSLPQLKQKYRDFFEEKQQANGESSAQNYFKSFYYDYDKKALAEIYQTAVDFQNKVQATVIITPTVKNAQVVQIESYDGLCFRDYIKNMELLDGTVASNFMFYTTPVIIDRYNAIRSERSQEQIPDMCMHMDYFMQKKGEKRTETFPLYNKGCIGFKDNGKFGFFNFKLGAGAVKLNGYILKWEKADVNPEKIDGIHVFTPLISQNDEIENHWEYVKEVGHNALNIVVIGDKVVCVRWGEVLMPSIGVVISLEKTEGEKLAKALSLIHDENGYITANNICMELKLDSPEGISKKEWDSYNWIYGGGMTIFDENEEIKNLQENDINVYLAKQGWLCPLSRQTQESDTYNTNARHPRTVAGLTAEDKLFICVLNGRTKLSAGATYGEVREVVKHCIGNVKYLFNMDGGSSSFLGYTEKGLFKELAYPCASDHTCAGIERKVNSLFLLNL